MATGNEEYYTRAISQAVLCSDGTVVKGIQAGVVGTFPESELYNTDANAWTFTPVTDPTVVIPEAPAGTGTGTGTGS